LAHRALRVLLDGARVAAKTPGYRPMRFVVDTNRPVVLPIEIVGLDHALALYDSVNDAIAG
jgi:anti-sigma B factor antagonist